MNLDILLNYDSLIPDCYSRFDRVLEVVSEDAVDRELSREHFRFFKQNGCQVISHDLKG
jgi:DNA polymerase-3 subunit chi